MPFKSKAQQRFMFAAEDRGELPKGTAERWADHTKNIKALPEKKKSKEASASVGIPTMLKAAYVMGLELAREHAGMSKHAAIGDGLLGYVVKKFGPTVAPGLAGAYLAGPDQRVEGAIAGTLGGVALKHLGSKMLYNNAAASPIGKYLESLKGLRADSRKARAIIDAAKKEIPDFEQQLARHNTMIAGSDVPLRLAGGAGAGWMLHKATSPGSPISYAQGFSVPQAPGDMGGSFYTNKVVGLTPEETAYLEQSQSQ